MGIQINTSIVCEDASPNPEYLIKSIAEQGYSLETSLADLMDNSISAKADKIEVLIKMNEEPFKLFIADNGLGMDENTLKASMQFPSNSPEYVRDGLDLGRFGLGMKTASFSQTRCFTVLSRKKGDEKYSGRTWDVEYLKKEKKWRLIVNSQDEIESLIADYIELSNTFLGQFESFEANTIVIWNGLYKFENYLEENNRQNALKKEITEVTSDYLSLVFHKFMERDKDPINIRINNKILSPFNPFPTYESDFRPIAYKQRNFSTDTIKIEGFVLPSRSIDESKKGLTNWTTKNRGLMDMEGIYIYRADRIILFGGWNGLIKKAPRLQLARLRVEIGNSVDHLLHLNVAKSQIVIPHDLKKAFERYIEELKLEAEKEFFNRGIRDFSNNGQQNRESLFERKSSNRGVLLELNIEFPLLKEIKKDLSKEQSAKFNLVLRMINTSINKIRHNHEETSFLNIEEKDGLSVNDIIISLTSLKKNGFSSEQIKKDILPGLGFEESSLPEEIKQLLN
jgi:hypothetical protein